MHGGMRLGHPTPLPCKISTGRSRQPQRTGGTSACRRCSSSSSTSDRSASMCSVRLQARRQGQEAERVALRSPARSSCPGGHEAGTARRKHRSRIAETQRCHQKKVLHQEPVPEKLHLPAPHGPRQAEGHPPNKVDRPAAARRQDAVRLRLDVCVHKLCSLPAMQRSKRGGKDGAGGGAQPTGRKSAGTGAYDSACMHHCLLPKQAAAAHAFQPALGRTCCSRGPPGTGPQSWRGRRKTGSTRTRREWLEKRCCASSSCSKGGAGEQRDAQAAPMHIVVPTAQAGEGCSTERPGPCRPGAGLTPSHRAAAPVAADRPGVGIAHKSNHQIVPPQRLQLAVRHGLQGSRRRHVGGSRRGWHGTHWLV